MKIRTGGRHSFPAAQSCVCRVCVCVLCACVCVCRTVLYCTTPENELTGEARAASNYTPEDELTGEARSASNHNNKKGLLSAAQQRRRRRPLTLTVPSVTTARDLVPPRKGETRPRTSHRRLASNNIQTLGRLNTGRDPSVVVRVDTDLPPEGLRQAAEHAAHSGDLRSRHPANLARTRSRSAERRVVDQHTINAKLSTLLTHCCRPRCNWQGGGR